MDFDLSDEQTLLADGARRYVREHYGTEARRAAIASDRGFDLGHWRDFADMGWLALNVPEDAGGLGGSDIEIALLTEQLGRGLYNEPLVDTAVLATTLIADCAEPALRDALLAQIAAGDCIAALAHCEPGARSEYETAVAAQAYREADGWSLSGTKTLVVHGGAATHWIVSARADGSDGYALFVVAADAAQTQKSVYELIDGSRGADLHFDGAPARLLLRAAKAEAVLMRALDRTIVAASAAAVGMMEAVMEMTADYLKQRHQYGKPLAQFQALQHRVAEMFVEADQARSMLYQALAALDSGDALRAQRGASGAKALIGKAGQFVAAQGIQLHGGIGITEEYAAAHYYKSMQAYQQRFGDTEFHLRRSLGLAGGPR